MAGDIVLTAALRNNLLSLQNTQRLIDQTQIRLATGLKVNSALDGPQAFFTAQSLNDRANDLSRLLDGIGQSIRTIEQANNGINTLTTLVQQAEAVALDAETEARAVEGYVSIRGTKDLSEIEDLTATGAIANGDDFVIQIRTDRDNVFTSADIDVATGEDIYDIIADINDDANVGTGAAAGPYVRASLSESGQLVIESLVEGAALRIVSGTTSAGLDGFAELGLDSYVNVENVGVTTRIGGTVISGRTITSDASAVGADTTTGLYYANATLGNAQFASNFATGGADDFNISIDVDGQVTALGVDFTSSSLIQDVIDAITDADISGIEEVRFNQDTGKIEIDVGSTVQKVEFVFTSDVAGDIAFGFGAGATGYDGTTNDYALTTTGVVSESILFAGSSASLAQYESDFNVIRDQIDALVEDANYRGLKLLNGDDMVTYFNEDRTNSLTTQGTDFTATGLGIDEADFIDTGSVNESITEVRNALTSVRNFGTSIANDLSIIQARRTFVENTINTLQAGRDDLTLADQNEEGANLLALQTRQALGTTALSLAAQSAQSVLRLF
ncbi:MAG: flagellin [Alphaproteobacteria bacterium]|nr:flagellin [Alphaproteobacteria bacterium]